MAKRSMTVVGIVDYGAGNIASVEKAVDYAGGVPMRVSTPEAVLACERLILPGVGAAGEAMAQLRARHLVEALTEAVQHKGRPFLGICLGMQLLGDTLYEFGEHQGLGWIAGDVVHLKSLVNAVRIPHIGWNRVFFDKKASPFLHTLVKKNYFYFAHTYTFRVKNPEKIVATVQYDVPLVAAIKHQNILATQFHPEKSQESGEWLMKTFINWRP